MINVVSSEVGSVKNREKDYQLVQISDMLGEKLKVDLIAYLKENKDIFAWSLTKMTSIPQEVITHKININSHMKPIK